MSSAPEVRFLDPSTPPHILTLTLMTGLAALSMNVFLPSLPDMAEYFETDYRVMQLSVAVYLAMNAVLQIILGPVSDRLGRRPVLLASFTVYVVATVGCIFAPTTGIFLAFRIMQAFVVTGLVLSRAVIRDMVPADKAASMIAYVTMGMSLVPMAAPAIGGIMGQAFGWQSTFWLQAVLGVAIIWLMSRDLGETHPRGEGTLRDQLRAYPELLRSPRFWGYSAAAMFSSGAFFAYLGGAPFVGNELFSIEAGMLGLLLGMPAVGYLFGNYIAGRYSPKFGINAMILAGAITVVAGLSVVLLALFLDLATPWFFFGMMSFVGLGNGMALPNANSGLLSVRPELAGSASGLGGAMMIGGGAAISAFVGTRLTHESGPDPLVWLMLASSVFAVLSVVVVIRREKKLALSA
ncbi:multidrug effflux MFS transporter [Maritimibacter alexandrii]|uniref:multidrug effflux MFS transporter n=1 Tax=Maritimibacter alexandrii TaxID=2570355 RepID=UPI001108EECB|nr:multidrug effflux MFS transporter [Maritimibacter alexandrii]